MKRVKYSLYVLLVNTIVCCFFAPFFVTSSLSFSIFDIIKNGGFNGFFSLNLLPFVLFIVSLFLQLFSNKNNKIIFASFLINIAAIVLTVFEVQFLKLSLRDIKDEIYLGVGAIVLIIAGISYVIYQASALFDDFKVGIRDIIEISIFVSFAVVLDLPIFKIRIGANGGSISLAMLPLFIICLRKGFFKGFLATGIVYGLITCLLDGYGLMYYPFDYLLGFGLLAIIGLFRKLIICSNKKVFSYIFLVVGMIIALTCRQLSSTLSGIIYYHLNFWESFVYNIAYIGPSGAVSIVGMLLLLPVIKKFEKTHKMTY